MIAQVLICMSTRTNQLFSLLAFRGLGANFLQVALWYLGFLDDLIIEMGQGLNLEVEEGLDRLDVGGPGFHRLSNVLEHLSDARFCILKLIFNSLAI